MSEHSAEGVAAEIRTRILRCTIAQGAESDLGSVVYQGRRRVDDDMIPCASIIEADDVPARGRVRDEYEIAQRYVVFAYVPCDPDNPNTAAHAAIRDMKRALFSTDGKANVTMGGKVRRLHYLGRDIGPRADGAKFVVAAIEVQAEYVECLSNP